MIFKHHSEWFKKIPKAKNSNCIFKVEHPHKVTWLAAPHYLDNLASLLHFYDLALTPRIPFSLDTACSAVIMILKGECATAILPCRTQDDQGLRGLTADDLVKRGEGTDDHEA